MAELGRTADEYQLALKKLLPKGPAWELDDSSFFIKMLSFFTKPQTVRYTCKGKLTGSAANAAE